MLNALNKTYTNIRTTYPLAFVYDEEKYIPLLPLPEEIEINVSGKGWKLLRKSLMLDVRPAEIHIQTIPRQDFLTGQALRPNVAGVLDGLQLNFIFTDTIAYKFDRRIRRKIPPGRGFGPDQRGPQCFYCLAGADNARFSFVRRAGLHREQAAFAFSHRAAR